MNLIEWIINIPKASITSSECHLLYALAYRCGNKSECWPSISRLVKDTKMKRDTIISCRKSLISKGLISFTGEMAGRQKQIPVMTLNAHSENISTSPEKGTGRYFTSTEKGTRTSPEKGTGTSTEKGTQNIKEEDTTTTCARDEKTSPAVVVVISEKIDKQLLDAHKRNPVESKHIKSPMDVLSVCKWIIDHREDDVSEQGRTKAVLSFIINGTLEIPIPWINKQRAKENEGAAEYQEYSSQIRNDIRIGAKPQDYRLLSFHEWRGHRGELH